MNPHKDQRLPSACDLCHYKKIRCNRQSPCANCLVARADCLRQRPKQSSAKQNKNEDDRLNMVLEGISRLVDSLPRRTSRPQSGDSQMNDPGWTSIHDGGSSTTTHPAKRRRTHASEEVTSRASQGHEAREESQAPRSPSVEDTDAEVGNSPDQSRDGPDPRDEELGTIDLQRYLTPSQQRHQPGHGDADRRRALEAAIQVAKKVAIMQPKAESLHLTPRSNFYDPATYPSAEFVHTIMDRKRHSVSMTYYLDINTNVSNSAFEDMAFALINHEVHGQMRLHYVVCVNYISYSYLVAIGSEGQSAAMMENLQVSKRRYCANAMAALDAMDLTSSPDIPMLQALLSGAMLSQDIGNMRRCWRLNTNACRICSSLGGRTLSELNTIASPEEAMNTRLVFLKCYIFDKSLSANMYQPSCLVDMRLDTSRLDVTTPSHAMLFILLELSKVQEVMVRETTAMLASSRQAGTSMENLPGHEKLRACQGRMNQIFAQTQEFRAKPPSSQDEFLNFEWMNIDFIYSSMMTSLTRLTSRADDARSDYECLRHARNSLSSLNLLLRLVSQPCSFREMSMSSLAWLVPLYPLRPIYSVFSNIVATSDPLDLKLLQDTANGLDSLAQNHASMKAVHKLCSSLIELCATFFKNTEASQTIHPSQFGLMGPAPGHVPEREGPRQQSRPKNVAHNSGGRATPLQNHSFGGHITQEQPMFAVKDYSQGKYHFDDDLDWELFCAQPSLDFFDLGDQ